MNDDEAKKFSSLKFYNDAIKVRKYDDDGKIPNVKIKNIEDYRDLIYVLTGISEIEIKRWPFFLSLVLTSKELSRNQVEWYRRAAPFFRDKRIAFPEFIILTDLNKLILLDNK